MKAFQHKNATSVKEAVALLSQASSKALPIAGGSDLLGEMKDRIETPDLLVNLRSIPGLDKVEQKQGYVSIGPLVAINDLADNPLIQQQFPVAAEAASLIASHQIRNVGTVGGNLCQRPRCWYYRDVALHCSRKGGRFCFAVSGENTFHAILGGRRCHIVHPSDLAPPLIAYDANITYAGPSGRKTIALEDFFIGPEVDITRENVLQQNEVVEEVVLPVPAPGSRGVFLKIRDRQTTDFATVSVAAVLEMDGSRCRRARVVLGAVAPKPWPVPQVDEMLAGADMTEAVAERAAESALEGARPMDMNAYKIPMAKRLVRRALLQASGLTE